MGAPVNMASGVIAAVAQMTGSNSSEAPAGDGVGDDVESVGHDATAASHIDKATVTQLSAWIMLGEHTPATT